MAKKVLGLFFIAFFHSQTTSAFDINQLVEAMQNITTAINNIEVDAHNGVILGEQYYTMFNTNLPILLTNLQKVADLPQDIRNLVATVNAAMPIVQSCSYVLGGCIVLASLIYATSKLICYCRNNNYMQQSTF